MYSDEDKEKKELLKKELNEVLKEKSECKKRLEELIRIEEAIRQQLAIFGPEE